MSPFHKRVDGVALVTGAGSPGIGRATSVALSCAGISTLYITDINEKGLEDTKSIIGSLNLPSPPTIHAIPGDISSPDFIAALFSKISTLDYAVNCAGVLGQDKPTAEIGLEEFDWLNSINYRGLWMCVKEELKLMLKNDVKPYQGFTLSEGEARVRGQRGSIVNIASQLAIVGKTQAAIYTASKAAVMSLTRSDAIDYSKPPNCIRLNSICPGVIATPMTTTNPGEVSERLRDAINIAPMERMGLPSEIADTAVWLCSGESSFVTGSGVVVDGGYVIN
ncbi:2-(R)-hydroxypropyl-CoM dehydrogenase [Clohesyomyces aquaticus]|uniref:2-(R)-hydroxypropyl-CoM dehydrogenase n=1 Tax=Clohesyomyces aquaticus TaxID=1231657 RepID=A0A1Y2A771_9PLEO|nr:2-(R)-hydroxypropyl-CoM dehydrogenase [Clohesyomyces aquaticus]